MVFVVPSKVDYYSIWLLIPLQRFAHEACDRLLLLPPLLRRDLSGPGTGPGLAHDGPRLRGARPLPRRRGRLARVVLHAGSEPGGDRQAAGKARSPGPRAGL